MGTESCLGNMVEMTLLAVVQVSLLQECNYERPFPSPNLLYGAVGKGQNLHTHLSRAVACRSAISEVMRTRELALTLT